MDTTYQTVRHREAAAAATNSSARVLASLAIVASGILSVAYPALRPFSWPCSAWG